LIVRVCIEGEPDSIVQVSDDGGLKLVSPRWHSVEPVLWRYRPHPGFAMVWEFMLAVDPKYWSLR
jgi:hypothetical protein